eukprot:195802-Chlamydomonas_euryale.AAC.1
MLCYERALRVLGQLEYPRPPGVSVDAHEAWLTNMGRAKFTYLVAAQVRDGGAGLWEAGEHMCGPVPQTARQAQAEHASGL